MGKQNEPCKTRWQLLKQQLKNLHPRDFVSCVNRRDVELIDVRTRSEFSKKHIKGAHNLDYFSESLIDTLDSYDRDSTYLVYCKTGRRSLRVCTLMKNSGFGDVWHLDGGTNALARLNIDLGSLETES